MKAANKLIDYLDKIEQQTAQEFQFQLKGGQTTVTGVMNHSGCSIAELEIPKAGLSSEWHKHPQHETFVWQAGAAYTMEIEGVGYVRVSEHRSCYVQANTPHRTIDTEGPSKSLIILVPGSELLPKGFSHDC